ncbi:MAG: CRTAC1 family protein [Myxococcota bacterium]|nr:CRTAC1 family protein [Myxococcota bacterium]
MVLCILWACGGPGEPAEPPDLPPDFSLSDELLCSTPQVGIDRFSEEAALRGLPAVSQIEPFIQAQVVAQDLDADGDIDLIFPSFADGRQEVHLNDGTGYFSSAGPIPPTPFGPPTGAIGATDIDGDGRPDLFFATAPTIWLYPNIGGGAFGEPSVFYDEPSSGERYRYPTFSLGDADGDGDLDFAALAHESADAGSPGDPPDEGPIDWEGTRDVLLLLEDGAVDASVELHPAGNGTLSLVGTFTDRDRDGDADLLVPSDRDLSISFWRNDGRGSDGLPNMVDDAADIHANILMDGMGVDSTDLNRDGLLDYCITDTGDPVCLLSDGAGGYIEGASAIGLVPAEPMSEISTIGWSLDFADLDHDGNVDCLQSSGPLFDGPGSLIDWPDLVWQGHDDGHFEDVTQEIGFGDLGPNFALATADFDGDGWLDVISLGPGEVPVLWMNQCGDEGWLDLELIGPPGNREGIGAIATVVVGPRSLVREMYTLRGQGQGPSRLHFGLGEASEAELLRVEWPGGAVSEAESVPGRRFVTVTHPSLLP